MILGLLLYQIFDFHTEIMMNRYIELAYFKTVKTTEAQIWMLLLGFDELLLECE